MLFYLTVEDLVLYFNFSNLCTLYVQYVCDCHNLLLRFDLHIDSGREFQLHKGINRLLCGIDDVH